MSRKIKIKIQEQIDRNQLNSIVDQMDIDAAKGALKALSDEQLNQVVALCLTSFLQALQHSWSSRNF